MYDAQWNIAWHCRIGQLSHTKTSASLINFATKQWRVKEHILICNCGADCGLQLQVQETILSTMHLNPLFAFSKLITVGCSVCHSLVYVCLAPLAVASLFSAALLDRACSLITTLWSSVLKETLAIWLFLMQMSSQACFSHLSRGSFIIYTGMSETPFQMDSLSFNRFHQHSSVMVESVAERYYMKMVVGVEVTEF